MGRMARSYNWEIILIGILQLWTLKHNYVSSLQVGQTNLAKSSQYQRPEKFSRVMVKNQDMPLLSRQSVKLNLSESLAGESAKMGPPNQTLSPKVIKSLDLIPLLESVARFATTKRGRDKLFSLVGISKEKADLFKSNNSGGRRNLQAYFDSKSSAYSSNDKQRTPERITIVKIAQSAEEAMEEYELVRQATLSLQAGKKASHQDRSSRTTSDEREYQLSIPPIYGPASSPFELEDEIDTDDDEWISLALSGRASSIDIENILQADQIVKKLLQLRTWADLPETVSLAPELSQIGTKIDRDILKTLH
eukprot:4665443-Ditylum_brightwellii.AAC.1